MTHVFNGMSALFPDGERFFVASVRAVREAVNDPQLQKDISAFIGQEAMHAKEHEKFNRGATENGYDRVMVISGVWKQAEGMAYPVG
ncbi:hypothetical protein ASQ50_18710 [Marinobacter sp. LQ44]|nr:hypothetical protein ASQ50_18710 [Marinobacter sp. LQ44]